MSFPNPFPAIVAAPAAAWTIPPITNVMYESVGKPSI